MQKQETEKSNLHPRNAHRNRYDFQALIKASPALRPFVGINRYRNESIDFASPAAVKALNKALLKHFYKINFWEIPDDYLCPPIPGRADYLHYVADLLGDVNENLIPTGEKIKGLDVGVGANCIYPLLGNAIYGWSFVGSDIDTIALESAQKIIDGNKQFADLITLRKQPFTSLIFRGIIQPDEKFDFVMCNPPFHASAEEVRQIGLKKVRNLTGLDTHHAVRNFSGVHTELWCDGGENKFISNMISESYDFRKQCFWFTSMVSKSTTLKLLIDKLENTTATDINVINMSTGNKVSRIVAWTFLNKKQQAEWRETRWSTKQVILPL